MSKYQRWYDEIIERASARTLDDYCEWHHILPRCLGGGDEPTNLVALTYREHFLVHWLLVKIYDGDARRPLLYAMHCMTFTTAGRIVSSWQFALAKRLIKAEALKRAAARREKRRLEYSEALKTAQETGKAAAALSYVKDRYILGEMANHLLKWRGAIKRDHKTRGGPLGPAPYRTDNLLPRKRGFPKDSFRR